MTWPEESEVPPNWTSCRICGRWIEKQMKSKSAVLSGFSTIGKVALFFITGTTILVPYLHNDDADDKDNNDDADNNININNNNDDNNDDNDDTYNNKNKNYSDSNNDDDDDNDDDVDCDENI